MALLSAEGETPQGPEVLQRLLCKQRFCLVWKYPCPQQTDLCYLGTVQDLSVCLLSKGCKGKSNILSY